MESPLQLDGYLIDELAVAVNLDFDPEVETIGDVSLEPHHLVNSERPDVHQLVLSVAFAPCDDAPTAYPYSGRIVGRAIFHLEGNSTSDDDVRQLVLVNGTAILLGLLRAHVSQVTALGLHGQLLLPPMNIIAAWEESRSEPTPVD